MLKFYLLLLAFITTNLYAQTRVIADMDIDSDVDDVAALAMLNNMHALKQIRLLGVVVTSDDSYAAVCADAINRYFNKGGFPIGILKGQKNLRNYSKYTRQIAEEFQHGLDSSDNALSATDLYRQALAGSPDGSVTIVTIGHLSNLQALLQSKADKYSTLSGIELVQKKVSQWLCMGGQFPEGKEANFYRPDPASTVYCLSVWNKPVIFTGWEIGEKIKTGSNYLKSIIPPSSPVYRGYELYNNFGGRSSWDQVAVILLTKEGRKYFDTVKYGYCQVSADGSNRWLTDRDSNHEYVIFKKGLDPATISKRMDEMVIK